jgi:hypothetical protein
MSRWFTFVVVGLIGCASKSGAPPPAAPDRATLVVTVRAEPKKGWHDPKHDSAYAGMSDIGQGKQFETVDYETLDEIVVWVEPVGWDNPNRIPFRFDSARASQLQVAVAGAGWLVAPGSDVYLRSEDGRVFELEKADQVPPGQLVELVSDRDSRRVGRVFLAPTPFVQTARSGQKVKFGGLPRGAAKVVCWHPRLPGSQTTVNLAAGGTTTAGVTVSVNSLPKAP